MITNTTIVHRVAAAAAILALLVSSLPFMVLAAEGGPTVTISSSAPSPNTGDNPIMFSVVVSESVGDFEAGDISVSGGAVTAFSGSGSAYTFGVTPGDGDPLHANEPRLVTVKINENQFDGNTNQASNEVWRWFDPAASTTASTTVSTDTTAPVVTITSGPADNSTTTSSGTSTSIMFEFTVDDASSTIRCSIVGQSDADSFFGCGSPQTYSLPDGAYRFTVDATDSSSNVGSSTRAFVIAPGSSGTTTSTTTESTPPPSGGGGGSSQNTSPSAAPVTPVREGGAGSQPSGTPTGNAVIPTLPGTPTTVSTAGNAVIPTLPAETQTNVSTGAFTSPSAAPVVSRSSGGLALAPAGSGAAESDASLTTEATSTPVEDNFTIPTSSLGAAVATSDTGLPGWVWLVLGGLVLIGVGVWALRQPAV